MSGPARLDLLERQTFPRDTCIDCAAENPCSSANCKSNEQCQVISRTCSACQTYTCKALPGSGGGINPGIIAGPIVAAVVLIASGLVFWWLRRKKQRDLKRLEDLADRARRGESMSVSLSTPSSPRASSRHRSRNASQLMANAPGSAPVTPNPNALPSVPADAEYYDENGDTIRIYSATRGVINADPNHPENGGSGDPFADSRSLSTGGASSGHSTNVIPIHFVPAGQSSDTLAQVLASHRAAGPATTAAQQAAAARTLDQARQNLMRPGTNGAAALRGGAVPPPRPARSPDLDLRLNPPKQSFGAAGSDIGSSRDSMQSAISLAPSYMSGATADLHLDAPKIMTRQQVNVGRLHAAEVVQFGGRVIPEQEAINPFSEHGHDNELLHPPPHHGGPAIRSTASLGDGSDAAAQPSPTDLRFSMGSLAYDRASISTTGTGNRQHLAMFEMAPPPVPAERPRFESISSFRSAGGDSLLGNFPMMMPSGQPAHDSHTNLDLPPGSRPPVAYKGPTGRPLTATSAHSGRSGHSVADSFLGTFPFLPPNVDSDGSAAHGSSPHLPNIPSPSRLTLGMSSASEGMGDLGSFDFSFDKPSPVDDDNHTFEGSHETGSTVRPPV